VKSVVAALTLALLAGVFAWAADKPDKPATYNAQLQQFNKISQDGYSAMRAIRAARMAIFKGQPDMANVLLAKAQEDLRAAAADATTWESENGEDTPQSTRIDWIPIDGWVALGETYVAPPAKQEHVKKANQYFKNGQGKMAIDELRLGEIDVNFTCVMMPLDQTMKCVAEAARFADEHKYYEANLALKEAEDGLVVDSNYLADWPQWQTKSIQQHKTATDTQDKPQKSQPTANKPQTSTQKTQQNQPRQNRTAN
jgi:hypothetical protein